MENISKSGATTVEGVDYLAQIPKKHDLVVVEYGNNDAATAWGISPESYEKNLTTILTAVGKAIVVGLCLPDPNNFEINQYYGDERLDLFNNIAKKLRTMSRHPLWIFYQQCVS